MNRKIILWLIWAAFIAYTLLLAPLDRPGTLTTIEKLLKLQIGDINAYIVTIFSLMGVWPLVYACLMFLDEKTQTISAWPSFITSNGAGVIGLIPYLILRKSNQDFPKNRDIGLKILESRWTGLLLLLSTLGLLSYAYLAGDWTDYVRQWHENPFVHLITWDFCLMAVVFPSLLGDDMARRDLTDARIFWAIALVPLLGPLLYLCFRPSLPDAIAEVPPREGTPNAI